MTAKEVADIMASAAKLELEKMEVQDQVLYVQAVCQFAEQMKHIVLKYSDKLPSECKFLFRL